MLSKNQEQYFIEALNEVYGEIHSKYQSLEFSTRKNLSIDHILEYLNRARRVNGILPLTRKDIEAEYIKKASGLRPDGGIWFVNSRKDNAPIIFFVLEVKHQGLYTGYTPMSDADWKNKKAASDDLLTPRDERPPQNQGNAIERFAKNLNAFRTLNELYEFNPYVIFCDGFDFFMKEEYTLFQHQKYAKKYKGRDSSIRMRLIAGNCFKALNEIYITGESVGHIKIYPATIMARMKKWERHEIKDILYKSIEKSLSHLHQIGEI